MVDRLAELERLPAGAQAKYIAALDEEEKDGIIASLQAKAMHQRYAGDPVKYIEEQLEETLWSIQKEIAEAVRDNERVAIPACHSPGKCIDNTEQLTLADGRLVTAEDLIGRTFVLPSFDPATGDQTPRVARAEDNGLEDVWRVTTKSGRTILRTGRHPLWACEVLRKPHRNPKIAEQGWRKVTELTTDDAVLVPTVLRVEGNRPQDPNVIKLAGYLIGDGGTTIRVDFTQKEGPAKQEFREVVAALGGELRQNSPLTLRVVNGDVDGSRRKGDNRVINLVREWGLFGVKSIHKRFPAWVWELPNEQLALFLNRLFACDGCFKIWQTKTNISADITYSSSSEGLIHDVERALLRLGVNGSVHFRMSKLGDKRFPSWTWGTAGKANILRFNEAIGPVVGKEKKQEHVGLMAATRKKIHTWQQDGVVSSDYKWDPIKSIEYVGVRPTVAIEVEETHAYVSTFVEKNSHLAARIIAWWVQSYPVGTAQVVTTSTTYRQVKNILWPHILRLHKRHNLPGRTNQVEWFIGDERIAYGFSASDEDPEALQGVHAPNLLILVDEAAGISHALGAALESLRSSGTVRIVLLGNPPVDNERTWFEQCCENKNWKVIRIPADQTPNFTGEDTELCRACPATVEDHKVATHLITKKWATELAEDYGENSPMVLAKVQAIFPKGVANKAIPGNWVDAAVGNKHPWVGTQIKLGVDVASDGGDEVVVARTVGHTTEITYTNAGKANTNAVDVAGEVLREIKAAEKLNKKYENEMPVRVKVDAIGVGWGVCSILQRWFEEGKHESTIVPVKVGEAARDKDKFQNQRAEMWWNGRLMLSPVIDDTGQRLADRVRLAMERKTAAQLTEPNYKTTTSGKIQIERKAEMKRRGVNSPDRAEAILLSWYEPPQEEIRRKARVIL